MKKGNIGRWLLFVIVFLLVFLSVYFNDVPEEKAERETYICEKNRLIFISFDWVHDIFYYTDQTNDYYKKGVISKQGDYFQLIIKENEANNLFIPKHVRVLNEDKILVMINENEWEFKKISDQIETVGGEGNYN